MDEISEQQERNRLVASATTLLGLVKHVTFVEHLWFDEAVTGRSREAIGMEATITRRPEGLRLFTAPAFHPGADSTP